MYTEKEFELINKLAAEMKDDCVKFIPVSYTHLTLPTKHPG